MTLSTVADSQLTARPLLATDRCDRCGAQAYVRVRFPSRDEGGHFVISELLFCGHHWHKHAEVFLQAHPDAVVQDERERLRASAAASDGER